MADVSTFRNVIDFFGDLGIYDVVLPFLLVFSIVFAIFEKSRVLGSEEIDGKKQSRKNLNAMAAFVIAFMVVASSKLVETITKISSHIVLLLLLGVFFILLIGSFQKESPEGATLTSGWNLAFIIIMFIGLVGIFLNALTRSNGDTWLDTGWDFLVNHWSSKAIASIILLIVIILFMWFVTKEPKKDTKKEGTAGSSGSGH